MEIYSSGVARLYGGPGTSNHNGNPLTESMNFQKITIIY